MSFNNFGNRYSSLSKPYFNERASPRVPDNPDRRHHHQVIPVSSSGTPQYAKASELYPTRSRLDGKNTFLYRPEETIEGSISKPNQAIKIPVVHLGTTRDVSSPTSQIDQAQIIYADNRSRSMGLPVFATGSLNRHTINRNAPTTDSEAEVDKLTNNLIKSMDLAGRPATTSNLNSDGNISRDKFGQSKMTPTSLINSRVCELQQKPDGSNGRDSPLNGRTDSSKASSPTSQTSSIVTSGDLCNQNTCFRCRKSLLPPEGYPLSPISHAQLSNNIVTLTGALAVRLHTTCFTCYMCQTPLKPYAYYHSLHRLLCPTCVRDGAVESCASCARPIGERIVRALGKPYHAACFVCSACNCRLSTKPFTVDAHGKPLCLDDFYRRYAPRCAVCNRPIIPKPGKKEGFRVVTSNSDYHLDCCGVPEPSILPPNQTNAIPIK